MRIGHVSLPPAGIFGPERKPERVFILAEITSGGAGVENPRCGGKNREHTHVLP